MNYSIVLILLPTLLSVLHVCSDVLRFSVPSSLFLHRQFQFHQLSSTANLQELIPARLNQLNYQIDRHRLLNVHYFQDLNRSCCKISKLYFLAN